MKLAKKKVIYFPFKSDGSLIDWTSATYPEPPGYIYITSDDEYEGPRRSVRLPDGYWKENFQFDEIMTVDNIIRGRSAAQFILHDSKGRRYNMFMADMVDLIKNGDIHKGMVAGRWTFQKRGANCGVRLVKDSEYTKEPESAA